MKIIRTPAFLLAIVIVYCGGCDLVTVQNKLPESRPADHLVINEIFTLPLEKSYAYSWVELFNPTRNRIGGLHRWTLSSTIRLRIPGGLDTTMQITARIDSPFGSIPDTLEAGAFLILSSDSARLLDHTSLGPGRGAMVEFLLVQRVGQGFISGFRFDLASTGQLVLRDTAGKVIDMVRYGDYVQSSPDSFLSNRSVGAIPEWYSLSRYAGAYSTGNTANDFYFESHPVPMWYSERRHP